MSALTVSAPTRSIGIGRTLARAVRAEATKAATSSFLWAAIALSTLATVAVAAGIAGIAAASADRGVNGEAVIAPHLALIGLLTVGALSFLSFAAWLVVGEPIGRTAGVTAVVMPHRVVVLAAKAILAALTTLVATAVLVPVAFVVAESVWVGAPTLPDRFLGESGVQLALVLPIVLAALSVAVVGLAALVRNPAVTIGIVVLWYGVAEDWVSRIPVVGEAIGPLLPVSVAHTLAGVEGDVAAIPGGVTGGIAILTATVAVLFVAGCVRSVRSDVAT